MNSDWAGSPWLPVLLLMVACSAREANPQKAAADLGGTSWQLVQFQGSDDTIVTLDDRTKYTIAFSTDGCVSALIHCNRGIGTWKSFGT